MYRHSSSPPLFVPDPSGIRTVDPVRPAGSHRSRHVRTSSPRGARVPERASLLVDDGRGGHDPAEYEELYPLVVDPLVTDVLVLGGRGVWVDGGPTPGLRQIDGMVLRESRARELAGRLIALGGRHVDESTPFADVALAGGIRVHVVLTPISVTGTAISIRLPRSVRLGLDALDDGGFFAGIGRRVVDDIVRERRSVLITGATGSGKTTLLGAMLHAVPNRERVVTVEDVAELHVDHPHVVALEARQTNTEGAGGVGLDRLVREALRMRPDRIVVGECRGAEVRDLMTALNTGHAGGAGTVHANGLDDVPARLEALGLLAGLDPRSLARQAASAFDAVLHVARSGNRRRLESVGRLGVGPDDRLTVVDETPRRPQLRRGV